MRYIVIRIFQAIVTIWILSVAVFLSVHITGDPAIYLLGPDDELREYEILKKRMGLDKPLYVQYGLFLSRAVRADFGESHIMGRSARQLLIERLPATLQLAGAAFVLTVVVGIPLGILSAVKTGHSPGRRRQVFRRAGHRGPQFLDRHHVGPGVWSNIRVAPYLWTG